MRKFCSQQIVMSDLSDVKRGMIIEARLAEVSVSRTDNLVCVSRITVLMVMTVYANMCKVSSTKHNSGRKSKLKDRDRLVFTHLKLEHPLEHPFKNELSFDRPINGCLVSQQCAI